MTESSPAVSAAVDTARYLGLAVDLPEILADRSNLVVHLKPAPVVARVATMTADLRRYPEAWLQREIDMAAFLAARGAPIVPPARQIPPGPHRRGGYVMTFWAWEAEDGGTRPNGEEAGRALAALHAAMADFPDELPLMGPITVDLRRMLVLLREGDWMSATLLDDAESALEKAVSLAEGGDDLRPLHGDASLGNLFATSHGLLWNDFEDVCLGPVAWDLAVLVRSAGAEGQAVLRGFDGGLGLADLEPYIQARQLQAALWSAVLAGRFPAGRPEAEARLHRLLQD